LATANVTVNGQPANHDTFTITNADGTPEVYEFISSGLPGAGNHPVTIGATGCDSANSLAAVFAAITNARALLADANADACLGSGQGRPAFFGVQPGTISNGDVTFATTIASWSVDPTLAGGAVGPDI